MFILFNLEVSFQLEMPSINLFIFICKYPYTAQMSSLLLIGEIVASSSSNELYYSFK